MRLAIKALEDPSLLYTELLTRLNFSSCDFKVLFLLWIHLT